MVERNPAKCRTMFSASEEKVIGKFLISSWNNKLKLPHAMLFSALKKHADMFPRRSKAKDNRPSEFWYQRFLMRNPYVQEAYDTHKASRFYKEYEIVSEELLESFLSDLASAEKPLSIDESNKESSQKIFIPTDGIPPIIKKKRFGNPPKAEKARKSLPDKKRTVDSSLVLEKGAGKKLKSKSMHQRSKTLDEKKLTNVRKSSFQRSSNSIRIGLHGKRGQSQKGLKLSPRLFSKSKSVKSVVETAQTSSESIALSKEQKELLKKKATQESPVVLKKSEVPAESIPLGPIKFEVGASIEAMDGSKWYKAKIVEVDHQKKEILVHFNGWGKRFDTLFPMTSTFIRGSTQVDKKTELQKFNVGDDVLSQWTDGSFYPGTVLSIKSTGSYIVMFYDGLKKVVRPNLLKPMSEKEKNAALSAAQAAYLNSLTTTSATGKPEQAATITSSFRRYRTSANDRERRIAARKDSESGGSVNEGSRKSRKRRIGQTIDGSRDNSNASTQSTSPSQTGNFHAKQARLDKITDTLLGKAVTTLSTIASNSTFSTASASLTTDTKVVDSNYVSQTVGGEDDDNLYFSDDSENPLIIDEEGDSRSDNKPAKHSAKKALLSDTPIDVTPSRKTSSSKKSFTLTSLKPQETSQLNSGNGEENLHQLADAAMAHSTSTPMQNARSPSVSGTGKKRREASEALLQLAQQSVSENTDAAVESSKKISVSPDPLIARSLPLRERTELGIEKVLKEDFSINQTSLDLDLKANELYDAVLQQPGIIAVSSDPSFMMTSEEDVIVNWIHDMTDLGWGISDTHISHKIKRFLTDESYLVVFDNNSPINFPSTKWLNEFLERHPEIFPAREKPLTRFRFDREGYEDWLVRWLAMLRSSNVMPNAVYYCDETAWDVNAKLLHGVKFNHKSKPLTDLSAVGNKISILSCIGADGSVLEPFHVFPGDTDDYKTYGSSSSTTDNIAFSKFGTLTSKLFFQWMKNKFMQGISLRKRPLALLVDIHLEKLDFDILNFAQENKILLYKFLPPGAHFIQHPDQKLFGRLRMQWKKAQIGKFMKDHAAMEVTTQTFANYFKLELLKIATSSTVKMCFELTKLYIPVAEPIQEEQHKERRNKRKSSKPIPYMIVSEKPDEFGRSKAEGDNTPTKITVKAIQKDRPVISTPTTDCISVKVSSSAKASPKTPIQTSSKHPFSKILSSIESRKRREAAIRKSLEAEVAATVSKLGKRTSQAKNTRQTKQKQKEVKKSEDSKNLSGEPDSSAKKPSTPGNIVRSVSMTKELKMKDQYKKGEIVLAKWSDCKLYAATVLKRLDDGTYKIRYYDGFINVVGSDFLRAWDGQMPTYLPSVIAGSKQATLANLEQRRLSLDLKSKSPRYSSFASTPRRGPGRKPLRLSLDSKRRSTETSALPAASSQTGAVVKPPRLSFDSLTKAIPSLTTRRRHSFDTKIRTRGSVDAPLPKLSRSRQNSSSLPGVSTMQKSDSERRIQYNVGDNVLCKWTDRRMYPATVLKQTDPDHYLVKYYDNRKKNVIHTWLSPWKPTSELVAKESPQQKVDAQPATLPRPKKGRPRRGRPARNSISKHYASTRDSGEKAIKLESIEFVAMEPKVAEPAPMPEPSSFRPSESQQSDVKTSVTLRSTKEHAVQPIATNKNSEVPPPVTADEKQLASPKGGPVDGEQFEKGDSVLARWSDCRSYPATILKITEDGQYTVQYYDGMTRALKKQMIQKWDPNSAPSVRRRSLKRKEKSSNNADAATPSVSVTDGTAVSATPAASVSAKKPINTEVKPKVTDLDEASKLVNSNQVERSSAPSKTTGSKSALSGVKPAKTSYTYEAYYASLTQESELNKFKCRAPGCNKVFRKESVLRQHHKHYHQQRYKLRDQEVTAAQKRKAAREEVVAAKRRVSSDYYSASVQSPKAMETPVSSATPGGIIPRSRGGKPPLDVYRMQQGADALTTSPTNDDKADEGAKTHSDLTTSVKKDDSPSLDKTSLTHSRKRRVRSSSGASRQSSETAFDVKDTTLDAKDLKGNQKGSTDAAVKNVEIVNEDVIRCLCGMEEEEGFMLQCDACLTWQHANCEGISSPGSKEEEQKTSTDYICKVCREPPGVRESSKYIYNNDFLIKGKLPDFSSTSDVARTPAEEKREEHFQQIMQATHQLMGELTKMQESLHGIRLKIDIASPAKNHSLLYLWKETNLADASVESTSIRKEHHPQDEDQSKSSDVDVNKETASRSTNKTTESRRDENSDDSDENSSVYKTLQSVVMATVKAVSPSFVRSRSPDNSPIDTIDGAEDQRLAPNNSVEEKPKDQNDEPTETQLCPKRSEIVLKIKDCMKEKSDEKESRDLKRSVRSRRQTRSNSTSPPLVDTCETKSSSDTDADIWKPIPIITEKMPTHPAPSRRSRSKSEDLQEGMVVRCRGNLLQHIHHLEKSLSERLVQLADYVSSIESSFDRFVRSSPSSSGSGLPSYDDRLGELQSDLGSLHHDIDAVQKLFSSPSTMSS